MNLASFRTEYPEFVTASDGLVNAKLTAASNLIDVAVYNSTYDQAHGLLTAHLLALAPGGQMARLDPKMIVALEISADSYATTTYGIAFVDLRAAAAALLRVF